MKKIGIPEHLPKGFYAFSEDLKYIEDYEIEIDHLTDEYDILINYILTWENEESYEIPAEELDALIWMADELKKKGGDDLNVLFFSETSM